MAYLFRGRRLYDLVSDAARSPAIGGLERLWIAQIQVHVSICSASRLAAQQFRDHERRCDATHKRGTDSARGQRRDATRLRAFGQELLVRRSLRTAERAVRGG